VRSRKSERPCGRGNSLIDEDEALPSDDIGLDHLLREIDEQIELLEAMSERHLLFGELLRVLREARAMIDTQSLQIQRLEELVDLDALPELMSILELGREDSE